MKKIWKIKPSDERVQKELSLALDISRVTAQLLANRGITTAAVASEFMKCSLSSCHDPFLLKDMDKAVFRIKKSINDKEKILVYGDYDVDGITGVAVLFSAIKNMGGIVDTYIPNRLEEGYGLNMTAIRKAHKNDAGLIVTVDCGITSFKEVEYAGSLNIDIIITDHHEIMEAGIPAAYAIINPLREDCSYPFKHLAGVGVAYKLVKALYEDSPFFAEDFLDLVGMGTVADIVPLIGENRVLAKKGLEELNRRGRLGLKALMKKTGLGVKDISCGHIGYILGPRINAMGRIGAPQKALELLLTEDEDDASLLADVLNTENRNRQKLEGNVLEEALSKVEREVNFKHHQVIVLAGEKWHPGVIGIVASRIADRFYRPAILISLDGKIGKGSGRSTENFHLFKYLSRCKEHLTGFGGHEAACGITIQKDRIDEFREMINREAAQDPGEHLFMPSLEIDMDIPLSLINEEVIGEIESLSPFGQENPRPVFVSRNLTVKDSPKQIGRGGFKIWVTDNKVTCEAVSFGKNSNIKIPQAGSSVDLAYTPSINNWQGFQSIQLELCDIQ